MKLQGRDLVSGLRGDDVKLLHFELMQLGFAIPEAEVSRSTFGEGTLKAVKDFQTSRQLRLSGIVDQTTAIAINRDFDALSIVLGQVRRDDVLPFTAGKVQAFDKDLRSEQMLGEVGLNDQGRYEIRYSADKFLRADKRLADLVVRVVDKTNNVLFTSDVIFNAPARQTVDIVLDSQTVSSEFERYDSDIRPLLERVTLAELTEVDVQFVAGETGIPVVHVAFLVVAHQHAAITVINAELFYGLFREQAPTSLPALLTLSPQTLRAALASAIEHEIIPRRSDAELDQAVQMLLKQRRGLLLNDTGETSSVTSMLRVAGLTGDQQAQFMDAYLNFDGDSEAFWKSLQTTSLSAKVRSIQNSLQLGLLTRSNTPLLQTLNTRQIRSIRDLARIKPEELQRIILGSKEILAAIPIEDESETNDIKSERFTNELFELLHEAIPTAFVQDEFERSTDAVRSAAGKVLSRLPDFELREDDLEQALQVNVGALAGIPDPSQVKNLLKRMQRTLRVAPHALHAQLLLDEGLDSAAAITSLSAAEFQERFAEKFGGERFGGAAQADVYYRRALQVSDSVLAIMSTLQQSITDVLPHVIDKVPEDVKSLPNFTALFGPQTLCSCTHCRSVLSPAAYLVDLLEFLNPKSPSKPLTKLRSKRPDLEHILLTCENTNTPLPYIDLVNEVLEFYVAQGKLTANAAHNTQGVSAEELSANPQFVIQAAYDTLSEAVAPLDLPFHRSREIVRLYLNHLGTSRDELLQACQRDGVPTDVEIACESLAVSPLERQVLTGVSNRPLSEFYQLAPTPNPESLVSIKVAVFLKGTSLTYEQLQQMVKTRYLNPNGTVQLVDEDNPPLCNLQRMKLTGLTPKFWRNAHRFLRLQRITGWTMAELDLILVACQIDDIHDDTLIQIANVKELQGLTKVTPEELASLLGPISTRSTDTLYQKLFLNKTVLNSTTVSVFQAVRDGNATAVLGDYQAAISAALRLNAADLNILRQHLGYSDATVMTIESLSSLYRYAVLARAIQYSITDVVDLSTLTNLSPFIEKDPRATILFVEAARAVRTSGFTIRELNYLHRHQNDAANPLQPTLESQLRLLKAIQTSLQANRSQLPDENATQAQRLEALRSSLQEVVEEVHLNQSMDVIQGIDSFSPEERQTFVKEHFAPFLDIVEATNVLTDPAGTLDDRLAYFHQVLTHHKQQGLIIQSLSQAEQIDSRLMALLLRECLRSVDAPSQPLLQSFQQLLDMAVPEAEAEISANNLDAKFVSLMDGLLRLQKAARLVRGFGMTASEVRLFAQQGESFNNFDWNALPISAASSQDGTLQYQAWARLAGWYRLRKSLPQLTVELADVALAATGDGELDSSLTERRLSAIDRLKRATAWVSADVDYLVGPGGFNLSLATDFLNDRNLARLHSCIDLSRRLGVSCQTLFDWSIASLNAELADAVVAAAKAKYSENEWLSIAKPLNDQLREQQKAALISYVLAHDAGVQKAGIIDGNGLFEYFLIDVEMSACAKTSRIKQAISSVQLFIQRCLLNLEDGVSPSAIDVERWAWMKSYRVWEANRKVFLYPENWIEPELRDDKSPFFQELESALRQNDLSWSTAEDAYVKYLEKLDQVARLQPCGMFVEEAKEAGDDEIVHVFGRTLSSPYIYYYRKRINSERWTPWEKIDQEINGEHLIPFVRNRRLYLTWLTFEQKTDDHQQLPHQFIQSREHWRWLHEAYPTWTKEHDDWRIAHAEWKAKRAFKEGLELAEQTLGKQFPDVELEAEPSEPRMPEEPPFAVQPPLTHWEIKLAWIENKDGQWSPRQSSTESILSPHVATVLQDLLTERPELGDFVEHIRKLIPPRKENSTNPADYEKTIISVYLPEQSAHFGRIGQLPFANGNADDGPLTIWIYRRYAHQENVLDQRTYPIEGYDALGYFQIHCGQKVDAQSFTTPISQPFESLARPDGTTNFYMRYTHASSDPALRFTSKKKPVDILRSGQSKFDLLYEHQEAKFSLRPPYQSFFYADVSKCYFATYAADVPSKLLRIPGNAIAAIPIQNHVPLLQQLTGNSGDQLSKSLIEPMSAATKATTPIHNLKGASEKYGIGSKFFSSTNSNRFDSVRATNQGLRFETFFHPHLCQWTQRLYRDGLPGLLTRDSQQLDHPGKKGKTLFQDLYDPSAIVVRPYPTEQVDFDRGAYAGYNWELFFHIPMLIAVSLSKNHRFEDAVKWFHFVFDPTTNDPGTSNQRYWNTLPFLRNTQPEHEQIQNLLLKLAGKKPGWKEIESQINQWRSDPFNPHLIARMRLTAYQKYVVMKYVDNIIAWADQLFSRDTLESINEATLLYILAWNILGKRPQSIPSHAETPPKSYRQISNELDAFGNVLIDAEAIVPYQSAVTGGSAKIATKVSKKQPASNGTLSYDSSAGVHKSALRTLHFCVPLNEEMLRCWDTVEDRLFKIRHCMNIEGAARQLPLFEPPIDPALLVKAKAAGLDLGSVLSDLFAPLPHYRFNVMQQKAMELCNELKSLGGALLSALDKRDAEAISNLRASQETSLLKSIRDIKRKQIDEAKANIESLRMTRQTVETRYNYYRDIEQISVHEKAQLDHLTTAFEINLASQTVQSAAGIAFQAPNATIGTSGMCGSPVATATLGGSTVGAGLQSAASILSMIAGQYTHNSAVSSIVGGYARRWDDWKLQETLASRELDQIDKQIVAAEIRLAITENELENHEQQIANSQAVEEFLRSKFTNDELYNWMIAQISKLYFQSYKLAYDLAKRAERTYRIEIGVNNSDFVRFGYWDNLRKGLLAGEQLALDLKRMDAAYLENNKREYELTKHVSMLQLNPQALIQLRQTGECELKIPEWWFDLDNPGHYLRRIKNVSLSIPCVTGPFAGVNCTLTLLQSSTRIAAGGATSAQDYIRNPSGEDARFVDSYGVVQSIVVSTAQNDSGLFETNFRDERYLPFEHAGVISRWKLRMPADPRSDFLPFDYDTISDVILHIRYTARDGGETLRSAAIQAVKQEAKTGGSAAGLTRMFSVRHEFPTAWAKFKNQAPTTDPRFLLSFKLLPEHYPFWSRRLKSVARIAVFVRSTAAQQPSTIDLEFLSAQSSSSVASVSLTKHEVESGELFFGKLISPQNFPEPTGELQIASKTSELSDMWVTVTISGPG